MKKKFLKQKSISLILLIVFLPQLLQAQFSVLTHNQEAVIAPEVIQRMQQEYSYLNQEPTARCFSSDFLRNKEQLCAAWDQEPNSHAGRVTTDDGTSIPYTYFDRSSDKLIVVGPGLPVPQQKMISYLKLFPDYDIITFDYRGQGFHVSHPYPVQPSKWFGTLLYQLFMFDLQITKLGLAEAQEVCAVVDQARIFKDYKKVFGVAQCYSAPIFVQAAYQQPGLFDKLILDGCWPSLTSVVRKIAQYPSLTCTTHNPRSWVPWLTQQEWFQDFVQKLTGFVAGVELDKALSLEEMLQKLDTPILFFQGREDVYCSLETFYAIFQKSSQSSIAILTDLPHGRNYLWGKEVFAAVSNAFFEYTVQGVLEMVKDKNH
ncbi:hypothetical protein JST56_07370 [Candidatus Dependentiae bacterium]|nr:hypothetical protein [Candidatus Dependentiae bacterium]